MVRKYNLCEFIFTNEENVMDEKERFDFLAKEVEAIYEDFDANVNQQILLRCFLKNALEVIKGAEPYYKLSEIKK